MFNAQHQADMIRALEAALFDKDGKVRRDLPTHHVRRRLAEIQERRKQAGWPPINMTGRRARSRE